MRTVKIILLILYVLISSIAVSADVRLPAVISDNMVLQQQMNVSVWGWAALGENVTVTVSWDGSSVSTKADTDGRWQVKVKTPKASGPYTLTIKGQNTIKLDNILIGEVWICSGQSNMEMGLQQESWQKGIINYKTEIASANYPEIRLFTVPKVATEEPKEDCVGLWSECSPQSVAQFSATAYFFARKIHKELGIPIGLIHTSWGGSAAEAWISEEALKEFPEFTPKIDQLKTGDIKASKKEFEQNLADWWEFVKKSDLGVVNHWDRPQTDTSGWKTMSIPQLWEEMPGMESFDGVVWFKKNVDIPQLWVGKELTLKIGPIDDMDVVWFNGHKIGGQLELGYWNAPREYVIPGSVVQSDENNITIRVLDNTGAGGLWGRDDQYAIQPSDKSDKPIYIAGSWFYGIGLDLKGKLQMPTAPRLAKDQYSPTLLYNGMVSPVMSYGIQGVIWYQGETNAGRAYQYRKLFPALIRNWRKDWGQGDFPFYFVQIAPYNYETEGICPELQEAQMMTLSLPNTGMAVTADIGNAGDIHPRNKQLVGKRLALWALAKTYGRKDCICSGPLYKSMQVEGNKIRLDFNYVGPGLMSLGGPLTHFTIAGEDKKFVPAQAEIENNTIVVSSNLIDNPVAVRYAWSNTAVGNLYNLEMLPASVFRTDNWPGVTFNNK